MADADDVIRKRVELRRRVLDRLYDQAQGRDGRPVLWEGATQAESLAVGDAEDLRNEMIRCGWLEGTGLINTGNTM